MTTEYLYLLVMVGIIVLVSAVTMPSLFFKRCTQCRTRNFIEAMKCKRCGEAFPPDDEH